MGKEEVKKNKGKEEVAIKVEGLSKVFKVPHEKQSTIKGAAVNAWKRKSYEMFEALKDVSFEVKKGEFFGIIGRNGSGKSTLLKILAGIYVPDGGTVEINGKLSPFLELGVGFNMELTGRENLFLGGAILGLTRKEVTEKFDSIVAFAELEEFIDMKMKNYSSGMQVRLAFSLAINAHAEVLLMDEVLAVGDSNFQIKCIEEFKKHKKRGKTVILVTHDTTTVQKYCDRALLLKKGQISLLGDPDDVVSRYLEENAEVRQNNTDQENNDKGIKNQIATIEEVNLFNKNNKKINAVKTGEFLKVVIAYKILVKEKTVNIGLGLRTIDGQLVFGYNTIADRVKLSKDKSKIELIFPSLNILQGNYYFNVYCCGEEESEIYEFNQRIQEISVTSNEFELLYGGVVKLVHEWTQ